MAGVSVPQMQKRDSLGEILKGLQVAATGFGLYKDFTGLQDQKDKLELMKQQSELEGQKTQAEIDQKRSEAEAKTKIAGGYLDVPEQAKLKQSGWRESTSAAPGAVPFTMATPQGDRPTFFLPPMNEQEKFAGVQESAMKKDKLERSLSQEKDRKTQENILRKEYFDDDTTKSTQSFVGSYDQLEKLIKSGREGGANDMAIINKWAKINDPSGKITDSDFKNAQNISGQVSMIRNYYDYVFKGNKLLPEDKDKILKEMKDLHESQLENQASVDDYYKGLAEHYNVNTSAVMSNRYTDRLNKVREDRGTAGTVSNFRITLPGISGEATAAPTNAPFDIDAYNAVRP